MEAFITITNTSLLTLCYKNFFANVLIFEEMRMKDFIFDSKKIDFVW